MNENCSNCGKVLPTNARFCPVCGGDSLFFNNDILKIWNYSTSSRINSFMNIPDGEEEDELPFI